MIRKPILLFFLSLLAFTTSGQSKKPQVIVYGSGADAYAAAVQSAKSNLITLWILDGKKIVPELTSSPTSIASGKQLDGGIWADFLAGTLRYDNRNDSIAAIAKQRINPQIAENTINDVLTKYHYITIIRDLDLRSVKKSGRNWRIDLSNKQRYSVRAVVDASEDARLYQMANPKVDTVAIKTALDDDYFKYTQYNPLFRTGVAVGDQHGHTFTLPLGSLIPPDNSNLFVTRKTPTMQRLLTGTPDDIPLLMHVGQALGAAASYTAFYRTASDKLDIRSIQGEILQYGARLMPFQDIPIESPHHTAIQRIGATGMLQGFYDGNGRLEFSPENEVSTTEISPVLNQLYSRSQIWFIDNHADPMKLSDLLSLIKYISHRGNELEGQVEKNWKKRFAFDDEYDLDLVVTRRHFAVLVDTYCKPFDVSVGLDGSIHR